MSKVVPKVVGWGLPLALAAVGCHSASTSNALPPSPPPGVLVAALTVTSNSLAAGKVIPVDFTCDGADRSPQVTWSAPPDGAKSMAVVLEDPDAPGGTFVHWVVWNLAIDRQTLPEGSDMSTVGAVVGLNDHKSEDYYGPCPPKDEIHQYYLRVFALDAKLQVPPGATKDDLYTAMHGHVLAEGYLVAQFSH
jgi:Raf kinase inhibitor-like YbhB/YbcL family protein